MLPKTSIVDQVKEADAAKSFPEGIDYYSRFKAVSDYIERNIHPYVTAGAAAANPGTLLTNHGGSHIKTVLSRIDDLRATSEGDLTCYEMYLVLVAAHLHDIGNAKGRTNHEYGAEEFVREAGISLGDDAPEKRMISGIAAAHGGSINGDKDKISRLSQSAHILGFPVKPRFLAALLRFADELADDKTRTSKDLLDRNVVPASSEIYHKYALALDPPLIEGDSVSLKFELTTADLKRTFGKDQGQVYLLDEIFERTKKMDRERIYCMRFLRPRIQIDKINVTIDVYESASDPQPQFSLSYRLEELGYPGHPDPGIHCSSTRKDITELIEQSDITGCNLKELLDHQREPVQ